MALLRQQLPTVLLHLLIVASCMQQALVQGRPGGRQLLDEHPALEFIPVHVSTKKAIESFASKDAIAGSTLLVAGTGMAVTPLAGGLNDMDEDDDMPSEPTVGHTVANMSSSNTTASAGNLLGRRLQSTCLLPSPECQSCLCKDSFCVDSQQDDATTCASTSDCDDDHPILYQGKCYQCPDEKPYFNCQDFKCYRCPEAYPHYRQGKCYGCDSCQYLNKKTWKCYDNPNGLCTTTSAVACPSAECYAPYPYKVYVSPFQEPAKPSECSLLDARGSLDYVDYDFYGGDYNDAAENIQPNWQACKKACDASFLQNGRCKAWTYHYLPSYDGLPAGACSLKDTLSDITVEEAPGLISGYTAHNGLSLPGQDYKGLRNVASAQDCAEQCYADSDNGCVAWSYYEEGNEADQAPGNCWLKDAEPAWVEATGVTSGTILR